MSEPQNQPNRPEATENPTAETGKGENEPPCWPQRFRDAFSDAGVTERHMLRLSSFHGGYIHLLGAIFNVVCYSRPSVDWNTCIHQHLMPYMEGWPSSSQSEFYKSLNVLDEFNEALVEDGQCKRGAIDWHYIITGTRIKAEGDA